MPNRIIKESICTSEDLDKLSAQAEILFYRLIVKADDYGCYFGNENIVKSTCFPLKSDAIKSNQVKKWLSELVEAGLIHMYEAGDGRIYLQFTKWEKHQQIRAHKRKFPPCDSTCKQLISDDCKCPRNPIQSNPIQSESNTNTDTAKPRTKSFVPPTLEDIKAYCKERGSHVDPQKFFDYFSAGNWTDSEGKPVKSWKQKLITWEGREQNGRAKPVSNHAEQNTEELKAKWGIRYDNEPV